MSRKKILVKGPALSQSGYGVQTRFALASLRAHEDKFDIFLQNISWGKTGWIEAGSDERKWIDFLIGKTHQFLQQGGQFDMSLQVTIPNEWQPLAPVNVGYTAGIEVDKISPEWIHKSQIVDRIIVVSDHAKYGFENTVYSAKTKNGDTVHVRCEKPVESVNYCVKKVEPKKLELELTTDFNFLSVAQWGPRKNVEATIGAFLQEFKDDEDVGLILKGSMAKNNVLDGMMCEKHLKAFMKNFGDVKCKVYLLHGDMTEEEMHGLYAHPKVKALISTTHGEGFGLPIFEAVYSGLPVAAPNWSGQVDFLYAPVKDKKKNKVRMRPHFTKIDYDILPVQQPAVWKGVLEEGSRWAYVKDNSTRDAMRDIVNDYPKKLSQAKKLQKHVVKTFSPEEQYQKFVDALLGDEEVSGEWHGKLSEVAES